MDQGEREEGAAARGPGVKPSALRLAFTRTWHLSALAAVGVSAVALRQPWLLVAGGGLEAAWLTFATRPRVARRLFARQLRAWERRARDHRRGQLLAALPGEAAERCRRLDQRTRRILELAGENGNLAGRLLADDLGKLDRLLDDFFELSVACARWERRLGAVDWDELEAELRHHQADAARAADPEHRDLAQQNLELAWQRRAQLDAMRQRLGKAREQLELLERTFELLGDQVTLMSSPRELTSQLDALRAGVEAVRETTQDDEPPPVRAASTKTAAMADKTAATPASEAS